RRQHPGWFRSRGDCLLPNGPGPDHLRGRQRTGHPRRAGRSHFCRNGLRRARNHCRPAVSPARPPDRIPGPGPPVSPDRPHPGEDRLMTAPLEEKHAVPSVRPEADTRPDRAWTTLVRQPGLLLSVVVIVVVVAWAFFPELFASRDPIDGVPADRL